MRKIILSITLATMAMLSVPALADTYSVYTLYRNPATPLVGTSEGANWNYPGNALSASSVPFSFHQMQSSKIKAARWVLVWNPKAPSDSPTGVRLVSADSGPSNLVPVAEIRETYKNSPIVSGADITSDLQALLVKGDWTQLIQQTFGTGQNGALIYGSWIEIVWE